jgi:hypothetical protein
MSRALPDEIHHHPTPPSARVDLAVGTAITGDHHHHPPTRKDALSTLVYSPPSETPAIATDDHRTPSVHAREARLKFKPDGWGPPVSVLIFFCLFEDAFFHFTLSKREDVFFPRHFLFPPQGPTGSYFNCG